MTWSVFNCVKDPMGFLKIERVKCFRNLSTFNHAGPVSFDHVHTPLWWFRNCGHWLSNTRMVLAVTGYSKSRIFRLAGILNCSFSASGICGFYYFVFWFWIFVFLVFLPGLAGSLPGAFSGTHVFGADFLCKTYYLSRPLTLPGLAGACRDQKTNKSKPRIRRNQ